jgi:protein SCO1/2
MNRILASLLAALVALLLAGPAGAEEAPPPCHGPGSAASATSTDTAPSPDSASARVEVPDVELVDQDGRAVRIRSLLQSGKPVVVSFIFTTCTTVCPMLSSIVSRVQEKLGDRLGAEVLLVSVTVDPGRDTPARLKAYATRHHARPGWTWLTGGRGQVEQVLRGMGAYTPNFADHPPMVLVGDGAGGWTRLNGFPSQVAIVAQVDEMSPGSRKLPMAAAGKEQ